MERGGHFGAAAVTHLNLADLLLRRGDWGPAARHLDKAAALSERFDFPHVRAGVLVNRALLGWHREEPEVTVREASAAVAHAVSRSLAAMERSAHALLVLALLVQGKRGEATCHLRSLAALSAAAHATWSDDREIVAVANSRWQRAEGDAKGAKSTLEAALRGTSEPYATAVLQLELAELAAAHDAAACRRLAEEARVLLEGLGAVPMLERAHRVLRGEGR